MSKKYDFEIVQKKDSKGMRLVAWALDLMEIQDKDKFLNSYTTTIVVGGHRVVYVSFDIGKGSQASLVRQVGVCVHESQHVVQADRESIQPIKYLTSDTNRAYYEADCYRATMEMHWFFTGRLLSPKKLANELKGYSVGRADRRIAEKHLVIASKVVKRGGVITGTSKVAIRWWKKRVTPPKTRKTAPIPMQPHR